MASVDDRIVRMEFDNASFERKIASTLTSLGQLDKALKFTGATQGLSDVSAAADKVHFGSMSDGIENISKKFLALSTVAITVLSNITSQALQAGTQFIKSFTITPILDGFHEFETNMNSIQTILANTASKGTTLTQVTDALNLLNVYSDKTIYNFGQMAKNIGTFTAAGVDLQTSVDSIKGIANLAAMSGSNADQASSAMYQLSQAIASGSLKLMDWNSVVNAGMGGEAFKSALFETGKAMGTLLDVPVDQTLKQWEDSGHSFRDSLQDGWITADVLTTTLQGFTGDMTKEMLLQKGFNDQQADAIMRTAEIAKAAATEVKTFTQLIGTVKEAVGTGFADSFRIIIGNFDESKKLFTDINNAIGTFVNKTADARNAILQGWKDMGGRTMLIDALTTAFHNFGEILAPIKQAFKDIFPPITADTLMRITEAIRDFANALKPTEETVSKIHSIFSGLFSALSIGWTIIKEGTKFVFNLAKSLLGLVTPEATSFLAKLGDGLTGLQASLVKGGKIKEFFEDLTDAVKKPIEFLKKIKDAIGSVFDLFDGGTADKVTGSLDNVSDAFGRMRDAIGERIGNIWKPLQDALEKVVDVLDRIWEPIKTWFQELGQKIADVMHKGDFNAVLDAINTGLLASIALLLSRFLKNGFKFDIGGGFLDKLAGSFEQLTGVLKNMQLNLKANALLKIAGAIAILAAALLVLSLIDSEALTKALIAMSVGFAQLMGSFALFTKLVTGPKTAASFTIMSAGLILLAGAMFLLALAAKLMSTMDWDELARGLTGVGGGLILMVGASKILTKNAPGMITAGLGLIAMAGALVILALAMKIFATMEWGEIAKGLVGVAGGLTAMTVAMNLMPKGIAMVKMGVGLIGVAVAMGILAVSMKIFATMDWEEIAKGMVGVGGGLVIIAGAMHLMPSNMLATSAALLLVGIALIAIAGAMKLMAGMSWEEMGKGLTGIAASLLILAGAMFLMTGALPGAAALLIISASLVVLAGVLKTLSSMSWEDIAKGLITIAAAMAIVAGMSALLSEAIPFIAAFGVSLLILGAGFALIGAGVFLVAKAFETFVKISKEAAEALPVFLEVLAKSVGAFVKGLAEGVIGAIKPLIKAAPLFAKLVGVFLEHLIDTIIKLTPKVGDAIKALIEELFKIIKSYASEYIDAGFFIIKHLLKGISENIGPIVHIVGDIITNFLDALTKEIPRIAQSVATTISTAFTEAARALGEVAATLLFGVGVAFIDGLLDGSGEQLNKANEVFGGIPGKVLEWIGDVLGTLWQKGVDIITGLLNGVENAITGVFNFFVNLGSSIVIWVGDVANSLWEKGVSIIGGLFKGITQKWDEVVGWLERLGGKILHAVGDVAEFLYDVGRRVINGLWNGMKDMWDEVTGWLSDLNPANWFNDINLPKGHAAKNMLPTGVAVMGGLQYGMQKGWATTTDWLSTLDPSESLNMSMGDKMSKTLADVAHKMSDISEFAPRITPVLDLTHVKNEAKKINKFIDPDQLAPKFSTRQARVIARTSNQHQDDTVPTKVVEPSQGVTFEQNIYAPTQLSTSDIYKQTRNQIRIAKEELSIP